MKRLTARQLRIRAFALEYVRDFNASRAATAAGWSAARAYQTGSELLDDAEAQEQIAKVMKQREDRSRVKAFKVLEETAIVAFSDLSHYQISPITGAVTLKDTAPEGALRAISSIKHKVRVDQTGITHEVEVKLWSKPETLRLAAQHLGMLKDKVELTGQDGGPLYVNVTRTIVDPSGS